MVGQSLGQYRCVRLLGEGAMGEVYQAVDELLERDVALKLLRPELTHRQDLAARFRSEATILARLDHPNVTRLHGLVKHDAHLFMVMEYVMGETMSSLVQRGGRLRWQEAAKWLGEILAALEYAHSIGVIHRDIKPANVIIRYDGRVKVTDFGIARVLGGARSTRAGHIVGTLDYMAPEQIRGEEVTASADLYSTGALLYEVLTGRTPYGGATTEYELMQRHIHAPTPSIEPLAGDVPAWFDGLIGRAMAKTPEERFASAADFHRELDRLAIAETAANTGTVPDPGATRVQPPPTRLGPVGTEREVAPTRLSPSTPPSYPRPLTWRHWTGAVCAAITFLGLAYGGVRLLRGHTDQPVHSAPAAVPVPQLARPVDLLPPPGAADANGADDRLQAERRRPDRPELVDSTTPQSPRDVPRRGRSEGAATVPATPGLSPAPPGSSTAPPAVTVPKAVEPVEPARRPAVSGRTGSKPREFEGSLLVARGRGTETQDAILVFNDTSLLVKDEDSKVLRTLPYGSVQRATFSQTTRRRLKFLKSTQRSLTLRSGGQDLVLRLKADNYESVLSQIEQHTGVAVLREE